MVDISQMVVAEAPKNTTKNKKGERVSAEEIRVDLCDVTLVVLCYYYVSLFAVALCFFFFVHRHNKN